MKTTIIKRTKQMDEECKLADIDLQEEDWVALNDHLDRLTGKSEPGTRRQSTDDDVA